MIGDSGSDGITDERINRNHFSHTHCNTHTTKYTHPYTHCNARTHINPKNPTGKLIVLYDDNLITIDGDTSLSFTEDVAARYLAYGWDVQTVADVNDLDAMRAAIQHAREATDKPSMIKVWV
jgi:hypothetical protein